MSAPSEWLRIRRGRAPLVLSLPHAGTELPRPFEERLVSTWRARKDADWWLDRLYDFAADLDATVVSTTLSRTVIDVNRDRNGVPLYRGLAGTTLCPTTTFDGEPLYRDGQAPQDDEIDERRTRWYDPYHLALDDEVARLRTEHPKVVIYDCHSIRSRVPNLFDGTLPVFNLGTDGGRTCDPALSAAVAAACRCSGRSHVVNGRFRGGAIVRRLGRPASGLHAIQMELACRGYLHEPLGPVDEKNWPVPFDPAFAMTLRETLARVLDECLVFARSGRSPHHPAPTNHRAAADGSASHLPSGDDGADDRDR